jgi:hypothetical protein
MAHSSIFGVIDADSSHAKWRGISDSVNPHVYDLLDVHGSVVSRKNLSDIISENSNNVMGTVAKDVQQHLFEDVKKTKAVLSPYTVMYEKQNTRTENYKKLLNQVDIYKKDLERMNIYSSYAIDEMVKKFYETNKIQRDVELESKYGSYVDTNAIVERRSKGILN